MQVIVSFGLVGLVMLCLIVAAALGKDKLQSTVLEAKTIKSFTQDEFWSDILRALAIMVSKFAKLNEFLF